MNLVSFEKNKELINDTDSLLFDYILKNKILTDGEASLIINEKKNSSLKLDDILINFGLMECELIKKIRSKITGIPFVDLKTFFFNIDCFSIVPINLQIKRKALVFEIKENVIKIAVNDPEDIFLTESIKRDFSSYFKSVEKYEFLFFYFAINEFEKICKRYESNEEGTDFLKLNSVTEKFDYADESRELLNEIIKKAILRNASDIHIQTDANDIKIKYRIDGILTESERLHKKFIRNFLIILKVDADCDISESRKPQGGQFEKFFFDETYFFRLSIHPTIFGENIVLRVLHKRKKIPSLNELGFEAKKIEILKKIVSLPQGLVLICGPTGSGKTTTLYSLYSMIDSKKRNIMTLEDPVEYFMDDVRQSEVNEEIGFSFSEGIKSILRQDPDVIFIGEIRDEKTAEMSLRASMTGHLVFSTIHTQNIFQVPKRLKNLGAKEYLMNGQIVSIISQRLIRLLCKKCRGEKCSNCFETGYFGRTVVSEILCLNEEITEVMFNLNSSEEMFSNIAKKYGYVTIIDNAKVKLCSGITTLEEIERVLGCFVKI